MWNLCIIMTFSLLFRGFFEVGAFRSSKFTKKLQRTYPFALQAIRKRTSRLNKWELTKKKSKSARIKSKNAAVRSIGQSYSDQEWRNEMLQTEGRDVKTGLVIERFGDRLLIEPDNNPQKKLLCSQRSRLCEDLIVVGDKVNFFEFEDTDARDDMEKQCNSKFGPIKGVVIDHKERSNLLQRPSGGGNVRLMKSIAANVDQVILVVAGKPLVPLPTIDKVLVTAHKHNMQCILVLNKVDDEICTAPFRSNMRVYSDLGYRVIEVSAKHGLGLNDLRVAMRGRSSVFVGQSGVGKSSLINALLPDADARVGELVRSTNQIGAHTTSSSHLFHLPNANTSIDCSPGTIIDSPGIREIGLWHLSIEDIREGFVEINDASKRCKYRNCRHTLKQEGCEVIAKLESGQISKQRYDSYISLVGL